MHVPTYASMTTALQQVQANLLRNQLWSLPARQHDQATCQCDATQMPQAYQRDNMNHINVWAGQPLRASERHNVFANCSGSGSGTSSEPLQPHPERTLAPPPQQLARLRNLLRRNLLLLRDLLRNLLENLLSNLLRRGLLRSALNFHYMVEDPYAALLGKTCHPEHSVVGNEKRRNSSLT